MRIVWGIGLGMEVIAVILMAIGLAEGIENNPGGYLFGIGAALAVAGWLLVSKVMRR